MKTAIFLLLLTIPFGFSFGQEKIFEVKIKNVEPLADINFNITEVIDAREDTTRIGYVYRGFLLGTKKNVRFKDGFHETISEQILQKLLPYQEGLIDLALIIHQLKISEKLIEGDSTFVVNDDINNSNLYKNFAYLDMEVEFAIRKGDQLYSLGFFEPSVQDLDKRWPDFEDLSIDLSSIKKLHGDKVVAGFSECLYLFSQAEPKDQNKLPLITEKKYEYDYHQVPPPGIYVSFGQLAQKNPFRSKKIEMLKMKETKKYSKYTYKPTEKFELKHVKYISDGKNIYVALWASNGKLFYLKSKHLGKYIYFESKLTHREMFNNFRTQIGSPNKLRAFLLNTETGRFHEFTQYSLLDLTRDEHPEILKAYKDTKRKLANLEEALLQLNAKY